MDLNTQQEIHLSHYWNVIRKRWKVAAAILFLVLLATFLDSYFSKPLYRSNITLQIEREFWVSVRDSTRPEDIRAWIESLLYKPEVPAAATR